MKTISLTLPDKMLQDLDDLNGAAQASLVREIGRSFILRFAFEELVRRPNALALVLMRKKKSISVRELA